jgi:hypothetical protein
MASVAWRQHAWCAEAAFQWYILCSGIIQGMSTPAVVCWWCLQDGIIAAKRIDMSKKGVETCGDVDEVRAVHNLTVTQWQ